ncbi:MAG: cation:proton antiporter, partial [Woeseiaceae bacterium]|nr:cation:proton antiporter [Woeseiaceae bacterium]
MDILFALLVLLLVTRIGADVAVRVGQPALVGELMGGIVVGLVISLTPGAHGGIAEVTADRAFESLLDLAVFFLMLTAGLEMRLKDLTGSGKTSVPIAVAGMVLPFGLGFALGWYWLPASGQQFAQALFLGVAMAITAVPVAVKVLMDLGKLQTGIGKVVVAAAVIDDILSLILLAVLTSVLSADESLTMAGLAMIVLKVGLFFVVAMGVGRLLLPRAGRLIGKVAVEHAEFSLVIVFGLLLAVVAEFLDMHFMIGAFAAGVLFTRSVAGEDVYEQVRGQIEALTLGFLAPVFFASIGLHLDPRALAEIPLFVLVLILIATAGKFVGAGATARLVGLDTRDAIAVGAAMNARGAVEIIIADIALRAGLFDAEVPAIQYMFSAVVIMAIVTTLMSPILL